MAPPRGDRWAPASAGVTRASFRGAVEGIEGEGPGAEGDGARGPEPGEPDADPLRRVVGDGARRARHGDRPRGRAQERLERSRVLEIERLQLEAIDPPPR